ncbi:MAG TPA: bifunctional acetate--CoA ligase family protein/GNAT family N-acetyltransferase [Rhizomicrobium sp.]|jgi:acetyltransferase|nr:bifunctional acetate--CoA ligase family protein/GNAT family N-acetyltransferase [Rhizomicrobium sp.]
MSIRNLDAIFRPRAIAVIGASPRPRSVGSLVMRNLLAAGFGGVVMPVNPKHSAVEGVLCHPDVKSLPVAPDLGVICTPPAAAPELAAQLSARGTRGLVVVTAGFAEGGDTRGKDLEAALLAAARPNLMRIVGPNCIGVISTPCKVNASFAHVAPLNGRVAFVTQSGAILTTVLDWATSRRIGFSHLVSLGDMADVDFGDMLDWLALDSDTDAILLYVEAVTHARKFMSAARAAARAKPVIAIKAGRGAAGARAAASHTGAMAGADNVYDAAFHRTGLLRVQDLDELFDALETLALRPELRGERLVILTNGGGAGVLAADALYLANGQLAELSPATVAALSAKLPRTWSRGNPADIIGDADGARYAAAIEALLEAPEADAVLAIHCPTAVASGFEAAQAVVRTASGRKAALLANWLGSEAAEPARALFAEARIPSYETPEKAVRGFMHLVRHRRAQAALVETPPSVPADFRPDDDGARRLAAEQVASGASWLDPIAVNRLLACYDIPVPRLALATDAKAAAEIAAQWAGPVALKIASRDITHKSDMGGVVLNLTGADAVREAAQAMLERISVSAPKARIDGFTVQDMIRRPRARELILGMACDAQFGPFLLFGHGGVAAEVIADKALGFPPLNLKLARDMIAATRVSKQLAGYRDRPAADLDAIALTLTKLSQMVCDLDEIAELDINPLLADENGAIALDARIRLAPPAKGAARGGRLAIRPYPKQLERAEGLAGFQGLSLRPIRPEDAAAAIRYFGRLDPEDVRMRFFRPMRELSPALLARLTQIDYDREMAFVLLDRSGDILGVSRLVADPDNVKAEFAVSVRSDLKGRGLGRLLMQRLIDYARTRGIGEIYGDVLEDNVMMLALAREMGCKVTGGARSGAVRVAAALS